MKLLFSRDGFTWRLLRTLWPFGGGEATLQTGPMVLVLAFHCSFQITVACAGYSALAALEVDAQGQV